LTITPVPLRHLLREPNNRLFLSHVVHVCSHTYIRINRSSPANCCIQPVAIDVARCDMGASPDQLVYEFTADA